MSRLRLTVATAAAVGLVAALVPAGSAIADPTPTPTPSFTAVPLTNPEVVTGAKSLTGQLAQSDEALLKATSTDPVNVVVKLDYDSLAAYKGGVSGYAATSPSATGKGLDPDSAAAEKYVEHIEGIENKFLAALPGEVAGAKVGQKLRTVYGGVALTVPANEAKDLLKLPGVAAVQEDGLEKPLTDSSAEAIDATPVYNSLGGAPNSGKGVIVGILDSGAWPEHPSLAEKPNLPAPPAKADGTPRTCDFGDNPLTPAADVFVCNNKLIGGQPFLDTYNIVVGGDVYPDSARDSNGHGTHTATTAAGGPVEDANPLGISRGPIHGIAPAAHVSVYKVCGAEGCYQTDSAAAVGQAILDGVDVINFSISGGANPYTDPVELAFLDAYAAGVFVAASAGNAGPGAATTDHRSPWVTTVAANTQKRTFESTITFTGGGPTLKGASITAGISTPTQVVRASAPPYSDALCLTPAPPGLFTGKIVACERGPNRVLKGFNVKQGGAVGMILYNSTPLDIMTDNHWLPTVHIDKPATDVLLAHLAASPGATATFTQGTKTNWQRDVITTFSSRGPGGDFLKPDVTAPGLHILAGHTPTPESPLEGPPGNLFQVIAGTSMSSPHVAGAAALVFAANPGWTPGQVKSALETTARTNVTKQDRVTPADPFDMGGGRIDLSQAYNSVLTIDETAADFAISADDPLNRIDLNIPSVNAPTMPGQITTTRTVKNVTGEEVEYTSRGKTTTAGTHITVTPERFTVPAGGTKELTITISAPDVPDGQYFGEIDLRQEDGNKDHRIPVAFYRQEGAIPVDQTCAPTTIPKNAETTCTVTVSNGTLNDTEVTATSVLDGRLRLNSVTGATQVSSQEATVTTTLDGRQPDAPVITPGGLFGYLPLDAFGTTPTPVGDEQAVNYNVPAYRFAGQTFTRIGITSNGYLVAGGTNGSADIQFTPQTLPDDTRPNGVLAPFWTDLDGTGAPGVYATTLTDGVSDWIVVEWRLRLYGTNTLRTFQAWIGVNGVEDISFAYPGPLPYPGDAYGLTVGAENSDGTAGSQIPAGTGVTSDYTITSTPGAPGETLTYTMKVKGAITGVGSVTTSVVTDQVKGVTQEVDKITVQ
ncbi:S8 family serine peptidase [Herbidospora galbida]|uniref:S8 family serine peptidase n=1 Tax=Herbidospora galbida TaxID=2575442 RepID=UPI001FE7671E|nr:S8 family serine peptidase [Herbidospora galbida]